MHAGIPVSNQGKINENAMFPDRTSVSICLSIKPHSPPPLFNIRIYQSVNFLENDGEVNFNIKGCVMEILQV